MTTIPFDSSALCWHIGPPGAAAAPRRQQAPQSSTSTRTAIHHVTGRLFMGSFDVRVFTIRRRPGRSAFEVRWRVTGQDKSRSFITRALADSYRADLIHAARHGQAFDPATGQPASWATPEPVTTT
jgi:hypothetical protein